MKIKSNFFKKAFARLKKSFNQKDKPVVLILENEKELSNLVNALSDATQWTGHDYDKILDRSIILTKF